MGTLRKGEVYLLLKGLPRDLALLTEEPEQHQQTKTSEDQKERETSK